jgi:hypothetical protein
MRSLDREDENLLKDMADEVEQLRREWSALMVRRDDLIVDVLERNPKAAKVDVALHLGVSDTIIRRSEQAVKDRR